MTLPEELEEWLDEEVSPDANREELLAQAIVRLAEASEVDVPDADTVAALERRVEELTAVEPAEMEAVETAVEEIESEVGDLETDVGGLETAVEEVETVVEELETDVEELETDVEEVEADVEELETDVEGKIDDVRDRVVQVLREAEAKAPEDHDHPRLEDSVSDVRTELEELEAAVEAVESRIQDDVTEVDASIEDRVEAAVSERLGGVEELEPKLSKVAGAVVRLQRRVGELEAERAQRDAMADLAAVANRHDVTEADCGHCGETVHVGLLATPTCPHCESQFDAIEPKAGFFGSATLTVGERPALEGGTETATEPADILED